MTLMRWQPFREVDYLQRDMNRLLNHLAHNYSDTNRSGLYPAAEVRETPEAIYLSLEVPGMTAKDLDIRVTVNSVSIVGERKAATQTEADGKTRTEFRYGRFERVIPLSARVQNTNVTADYQDGILKLVLPKAEEEKNKVVKVDLN
jgi:HSP20 family protein